MSVMRAMSAVRGTRPAPARALALLGAAALLAGLLTAAGTLTAAVPAGALDNGLARTPPMGWDDFNAYGCNNNATDVEQTARYLHGSGLEADGYRYVIVDGCWNDLVGQGTDDPNGFPSSGPLPPEACGAVNGRLPDGELFVNTTEFPPSSSCANDGLKRVADYVHSLGLKFGLWIDAGNNWNCQEIPGSYGFDRTDATTLAAWGADYVKADWCGGNPAPPQGDPYGGPTFFNQPGLPADHQQLAQLMYTALGTALAATGRPIVYSMCNGYDTAVQPQAWGAPVANLWRTGADLQDSWSSLVATVNHNASLASSAGPGSWNDPDMLQIGNGGMTRTEDQSEFSLWAEMAAPLIMGTNLASPDGGATQQAYDQSIFGNTDVIAVDQDPLGAQGHIVSFDGTHQILAKPLAGGDVAVTLFNEGSTAAVLRTSVGAIGLGAHAPVYTLTGLWSKKVTETAGTISAYVQPHQTVMYRVHIPQTPGQTAQALASPPDTTLSITSSENPITAGSPAKLAVSLTNYGVLPVGVTKPLKLTAPGGWTAGQGTGDQPAVLGTGDSTSATFPVTPPSPSKPIGTAEFTGSASYLDTTGTQQGSTPLDLPFVSPVTSPYHSADDTGGPPPAVFGQLGTDFGITAAGQGLVTSAHGPGADQYAAIYLPASVNTGSAAVAQVTSLPGPAGGGAVFFSGAPVPQAGLIIRNDATGQGPEGVALYLNGYGQLIMSWASAGGPVMDTARPASGNPPGVGTWLRVLRTGTNNYSGYYSTTSANGPWTLVANATTANAAAVQDVGVFASSQAPLAPITGTFHGFAVGS
jgi:alpha-galactosidase